MNKNNDLLVAQNRVLDKMEKHGRPKTIVAHPYLEKHDGGTVNAGSDSTGQGERLG